MEILADTVRDNGGNWLESRLSHLAGKFAGIVRINIEEQQFDALEQSFAALSESGIAVTLASDGGNMPYRAHTRSPSLINYQCFEKLNGFLPRGVNHPIGAMQQ